MQEVITWIIVGVCILIAVSPFVRRFRKKEGGDKGCSGCRNHSDCNCGERNCN